VDAIGIVLIGAGLFLCFSAYKNIGARQTLDQVLGGGPTGLAPGSLGAEAAPGFQ
jgi:hypothetical protein